MSFSFTRILLDDTELEIFRRGVVYATEQKISPATFETVSNNGCRALVQGGGTRPYEVALGFKHTGSPKFICTCPYNQQYKVPCKHIVATALIWDRSRAVPDPTDELAQELCVPPPRITGADITRAFKDPLHADLTIIREATDERRWTRPHQRLPDKPRSCLEPFIDLMQIRRARRELESWARRAKFDPYFCAGETMAAYCELARWVRSGIETLAKNISQQIACADALIELHRVVVMELIDDSDGLHKFSEAHLKDLLQHISGRTDLTTKQLEEIERLKNRIEEY